MSQQGVRTLVCGHCRTRCFSLRLRRGLAPGSTFLMIYLIYIYLRTAMLRWIDDYLMETPICGARSVWTGDWVLHWRCGITRNAPRRKDHECKQIHEPNACRVDKKRPILPSPIRPDPLQKEEYMFLASASHSISKLKPTGDRVFARGHDVVFHIIRYWLIILHCPGFYLRKGAREYSSQARNIMSLSWLFGHVDCR